MNKQQGIAIVMITLIVALISASVSIVINKQIQLLENTDLIAKQNKAIQYFNSVKSLVEVELNNDKNRSYDSDDEEWYTRINNDFALVAIDDVVITNKISTLNAKLNINNFIKINDGRVKIRENPNFSTCLLKLANRLEIDDMSSYIVDHLNAKSEKSLIKNITEIKNIESISPNDYYKMKRFIFAIDGGVVKININTADKEILECLHYDLADVSVEEIIKNRPFKSIDSAKKELSRQLPHLTNKEINDYFNNMIDIKTKYFILNTTVRFANVQINFEALLVRNKKNTTTHMNKMEYIL